MCYSLSLLKLFFCRAEFWDEKHFIKDFNCRRGLDLYSLPPSCFSLLFVCLCRSLHVIKTVNALLRLLWIIKTNRKNTIPLWLLELFPDCYSQILLTFVTVKHNSNDLILLCIFVCPCISFFLMCINLSLLCLSQEGAHEHPLWQPGNQDLQCHWQDKRSSGARYNNPTCSDPSLKLSAAFYTQPTLN